MAGIKVRYAIEVNPAAKSFELNHKGAKVICGDIRDVKAIDFLNKDEEVFIIMGGPPCQIFYVKYDVSQYGQPNNLLFKEFVRLVSEIKPRWFVLENVWGMTKMNNERQ